MLAVCYCSLQKLSYRFYNLLWLRNLEQRGREKHRRTLCHSRKASALPWTRPQPWDCCGLKDLALALCGPLLVFLLGDMIMICMVYPIPSPTGSKSQAQDRGDRSCSVPSPQSRGHRDEFLDWVGVLVSAILPTLLRSSDTGMALPPCKMLSEMLLSLHTRGPT